MNCPDDLDIELFVLSVDPDWRDHWLSIDDAFDHYWKYLDSHDKIRAMKEAR